MASQQPPHEWQRLAAASSVVDAVAPHVENLVQVPGDDVPEWLTALGVPAKWRIARLDGNTIQPSRIAVCGPHFDGGWDACETITVFRFSGTPPVDVIVDNADRALRELDAADITTETLTTSPTPGAAAVRSNGYFSAAGLWVWAQYSIYSAEAATSGRVC